MNRLRALFMAIAAAIVVLEVFVGQFLPTEWNQMLLIVAVACVAGLWATSYATRNEVKS